MARPLCPLHASHIAHDIAVGVENTDRRYRAEPEPLLVADFTNEGFGTEDRWRVVIRPRNEGRAGRTSHCIRTYLLDANRPIVV